MSVSSIAPENTTAVQKHSQTKPVPKEADSSLSITGKSKVSENYQVNKDGDSFEFQYNKTTVESYKIKAKGLDEDQKDLLNGFDINDFQGKIKSQLLDMVFNANKKATELHSPEALLDKYGTDVVYSVPEGTEAAEVPEFWNAENTSQRLVDFAMSFKDVAGFEDDAEYIEEVRGAVMEGFRQAKGIIGDSGDKTNKLYNDTFDLTMQKFDALLEEARGANQGQAQQQPVNMVA